MAMYSWNMLWEEGGLIISYTGDGKNILYETDGIVNLFHSLLPALTMVILSLQSDLSFYQWTHLIFKNRSIWKIAISLIIHCQGTLLSEVYLYKLAQLSYVVGLVSSFFIFFITKWLSSLESSGETVDSFSSLSSSCFTVPFFNHDSMKTWLWEAGFGFLAKRQ